MQIEFWDGGGAKSVALALTNDSPQSGFSLPMLDKPLGRLTFADAMRQHGSLRYRTTARTSELLFEDLIGPPGALKHCAFGALSPHAPGSLAPVSFVWDADTKSLHSPPQDVSVNWIGVSESSDEQWFDWSIALP